MSRYFIFYFFILSFSTFSQTTDFAGGNICNTNNWQLVFNDEFNGDSLDHSKWFTYYPYTATGEDTDEYTRTHGDGEQIYLDSNIIINNGTLKLIAKRQSVTWFSAFRNYTCGMLHSREAFMYGKFEISCKISSQSSIYPAFWLFGGNGTEIDVFEFCGETSNHHHLGIAKWEQSNKVAYEDHAYDSNDFSDGFHLFSVEWDPFFISFDVDGKEVYKITRLYTLTGDKVDWCCVGPGVYNFNPAFPQGDNNKINVIVSLALGSACKKPDNSTVLPDQFEVDYVRVYQRDQIKNTLETCLISLFPNPVKNNLFIKHDKMSSIQIVNSLGMEVYTSKLNSDEAEIDVRNFPNGFYIIIVASEYGLQAAKFSKV